MNKPLNILISAYACGPNWGSEIGMGWNWVIHLSAYCKLHVIVEANFKKDIEEKLGDFNLKYTPQFYYNDIGERGRKLFWKQGSFLFYYYYKQWQKQTFTIAQEILKSSAIDIVHQLNMIGYREPGYLWKIEDKPFVWGPVGGFNQIPTNYLASSGLKGILFYSAKHVVNSYQKQFLSRFRKSAKRANLLIAATKKSKMELDKVSDKDSYVMGETGCHLGRPSQLPKATTEQLKILWVGRLQVTKALPLALKALKEIDHKLDYELIIVGDGPQEKTCKSMAKTLELDKKCTWMGRIPNDKVHELMQSSSFFLFTSLKEGSPHVVTEALQNGLPVVCHNACGHGVMVDNSCGLKIPMINPKESIRRFSEKILELGTNTRLREELSQGAIKRARELTWEEKAKEMITLYHKVL